jgi:hypothetical protein
MGKFKITQSPDSKNIYLYPNNNGCINECSAFGDAPNYNCVNDEWDALEPETDYAWMEGASSVSEMYAMGNHGSVTGTINYVKAHCKAKSDKYPPHINAEYKVAIGNGVTMGYTTLTLRPSADGAFSQWIPFPTANHWECVDEVVCDNTTTYLREGTNGDKDYLILPNHTTETGTITKVEVFICASGNVDDATINLAIYDTSSTNVINHATTWTFAAGWHSQSHVFATNPDGGAWTWGDIDDLQIGVEKTGGTFPNVSQMYVEITYESGYICNGFAMSDNMPLCTGYGLFEHAWLENPWTFTDWTWGDIDGVQCGFECSSPSVVMTPFPVLPMKNGDRTDITNVTTGYEHWEAVEKSKPYSEVFESGAAWKYDLYKFVQAGTDYYPSGVGADERKFFPFEHNGKDYVMLCGYLPGIYVYEWTGEYLKLIAHAVTTEEALCVAFDGTYFYVGGSDAANGIVMAYTFDGENLTHVGTDYAAGVNSPLNISINGSIESNDGYIYFTGANGQLEALTFNGSTFTQEGIIAGTSIWIYCDGTYIHANKRAFSFDGTNFTNICGGGDDFIMGGDGTYLYATDDVGFNAYIRAYTFDGSAYTLVGSVNTGATGTSYMLCCSLPVFDGYIYAFITTGGVGGELRAYTFDGTNFTLEGSTSETYRKTYMYSDGRFLYTTEFGNPAEGSSKIYSFSGSEFKELAIVNNGTTPKYLDDNITSVTVIAKMGKDPSAPDQADIRGCFTIKTGGVEFNTSANYYTLESKQRYYAYTYLENPNTSAAWTLAEVQALQAGIGLYGTGTKYATCSRCYIVVGAGTNVSPEIQTCQTYIKVNYSPDDIICWMPKPKEISTNHTRNIKMLNFWNGEREVYDVNRSGKSMVLTGGITNGNPDVTDACTQIICVRDMARDGTVVTISGLNPVYFNGSYRINSFGWNKISEKPENYKWILELESAY